MSTTKNIFSNTATQTAVVSTNISNASNTDYNRRSAATTTNAYTGATIVATERTENAALLKQTLSSIADDAGQQTLVAGLDSLNAVMGGSEYSLAPSTSLAALNNALQTYAATPSDSTLASAAVNAAVDVATALNESSSGVQELRADSDSEIATTVTKLNQLLSDFKTANDAVQTATAAGSDANNALDTRESLLKQISGIIGVTTSIRDNNDMVIYTSDGTTLFETNPRTVSFDATTSYSASTVGNAVYIDGVALDAGEGSSTTAQGSLQAQLQLRDEIYPTYQDQLDEMARGLVSLFSETSSDGGSPATLTPIAGLFTTNTGAVVDFENPTIITGLAASIKVSDVAIADPTTLRDGDVAGDAVNTANSSGYSDLLYSYVAGFNAKMDFDPAAGVGDNVTLLDFSTDSVGWAEEYRSNATTASETTTAMLSRSTAAYSNATGVNLDEELILMLDVEQSYKAASKLLSTIDDMLQALMQAAG